MTAIVNAPADPGLAVLWRVAIARYRAAMGHAPERRDEFHEVIEAYHGMLNKQRGSLSSIIKERCADAPGGD